MGTEKIVHAQNCGTELLQALQDMVTAKGVPVLDETDLAMLGLVKEGESYLFLPGRDMQPQELYEHLRWKEHVLRERSEL